MLAGIGALTWLTDQGSNLDSSEPKSDVLPVTLSVSAAAKVTEIFISHTKSSHTSIFFNPFSTSGHTYDFFRQVPNRL